MIHSPQNHLPPEGKRATNGSPSGTCSGGTLTEQLPPEPFIPPSHTPEGKVSGTDRLLGTSAGGTFARPPAPFLSQHTRVVLFWAGEVLGVLSLAIILFVLLFFAGVSQ